MEAPSEFPSVTLYDLAASSSAASAAPVDAVFALDSSGKTRLRFVQTGSVSVGPLVDLDLETTQVVINFDALLFGIELRELHYLQLAGYCCNLLYIRSNSTYVRSIQTASLCTLIYNVLSAEIICGMSCKFAFILADAIIL